MENHLYLYIYNIYSSFVADLNSHRLEHHRLLPPLPPCNASSAHVLVERIDRPGRSPTCPAGPAALAEDHAADVNEVLFQLHYILKYSDTHRYIYIYIYTSCFQGVFIFQLHWNTETHAYIYIYKCSYVKAKHTTRGLLCCRMKGGHWQTKDCDKHP